MEHRDPVALLAPERPHDDPVGRPEVGDRSALGEKLGIRDVADMLEPPGIQPRAHPLAGSGRNRALHDEHEFGLRVGKLVDHLPDGAEIRVTRVGGWSPDADEDKLSLLVHLGRARGEAKAIAISIEQLDETRLVHRNSPGLEVRDPRRVDVAEGHLVAEVGEAGCGDEPHPPGSDDADWLLSSPDRRKGVGKHAGSRPPDF